MINGLGGQTHVAEKLNLKPSTVGMWMVRNKIPFKYLKDLKKEFGDDI